MLIFPTITKPSLRYYKSMFIVPEKSFAKWKYTYNCVINNYEYLSVLYFDFIKTLIDFYVNLLLQLHFKTK